MNQFVPYFLGDQKAPYSRAADTQKCIRAGGKHNDLEDVGFRHIPSHLLRDARQLVFRRLLQKRSHRMELGTTRRRLEIPARTFLRNRLQTRRRRPCRIRRGMHAIWTRSSKKPDSIPPSMLSLGNKQDNFWMMGETGPCGPCSELHLDLTPDGRSEGKLVNADSHLCIEIWNLVFIQFNADRNGNFTPSPLSMWIPAWASSESPPLCKRRMDLAISQNPYPITILMYFPHIFSKLGELSGKIILHPTRRWQTGQRARGNRHCFPRHRRPSSCSVFLDCGRNSARQW